MDRGSALILTVAAGAGGVTAVLVCSQLIVSAVLDRYGALGLDTSSLGWQGWLGAALLVGGTILMTTR